MYSAKMLQVSGFLGASSGVLSVTIRMMRWRVAFGSPNSSTVLL